MSHMSRLNMIICNLKPKVNTWFSFILQTPCLPGVTARQMISLGRTQMN